MENIELFVAMQIPAGISLEEYYSQFKHAVTKYAIAHHMKNMAIFTTLDYPDWIPFQLANDGTVTTDLITNCPVYIDPDVELINDAGLSDVWLLNEVGSSSKMPLFILADEDTALVIRFVDSR